MVFIDSLIPIAMIGFAFYFFKESTKMNKLCLWLSDKKLNEKSGNLGICP